MQNYYKKSAGLANFEDLESWAPDKNMDQLFLVLKSLRFNISFSNMFADLEANISVFDLEKGKTYEARAVGKSEAEAGFRALCELIDVMGI